MSNEGMSERATPHGPRAGEGVDRTLIRAMLDLTPADRLQMLQEEALFLDRLDRAGARRRSESSLRRDRT